MKRLITLSDYITSMGDAKAAEVLGETERAVADWRRETRVPATIKARKLMERSQGVLTMEGIYARDLRGE